MLLLDFNYQTLNRNSLQYSQTRSIQDYDSSSPLASPNFIRAKDRQAVAGRYPTDVTQKFDQYYWQAQLNLMGQRLTYVGFRSNQLLDGISPQDNAGLFANQVAPLSYFAGVSPTGIIGIPTGQSAPYAWHSITTAKNTSHEIRLQNDSRIADMFDYVVGYMQYDTGSDTDFNRSVGVVATPFPPALPTTIAQIYSVPLVRYIDEKEQSIFSNLTVHLGEGTELSGGLRHIRYKSTSGLTTFGVENLGLLRNGDLNATIWTASAKQRVNENLMVYASAGSSWRPETVASAARSMHRHSSCSSRERWPKNRSPMKWASSHPGWTTGCGSTSRASIRISRTTLTGRSWGRGPSCRIPMTPQTCASNRSSTLPLCRQP